VEHDLSEWLHIGKQFNIIHIIILLFWFFLLRMNVISCAKATWWMCLLLLSLMTWLHRTNFLLSKTQNDASQPLLLQALVFTHCLPHAWLTPLVATTVHRMAHNPLVTQLQHLIMVHMWRSKTEVRYSHVMGCFTMRPSPHWSGSVSALAHCHNHYCYCAADHPVMISSLGLQFLSSGKAQLT